MLWPQRSIPEIFTSQVRRVLKKSVWASNPCRICYYSQEIIICRDDLASRLRRNNVCATKQPVQTGSVRDAIDMDIDEPTQQDTFAMSQTTEAGVSDVTSQSAEILESEQIIHTILNQGHISPWTKNLRPTITEYEHALTLSPLPTSV